MLGVVRASAATSPNRQLTELRARKGEGNAAWLRRAGASAGIVLFGGTSIADWRLRFAQSVFRDDLTPSHWSLAGLLVDEPTFLSVPLELDDVAAVPPTNGIRTCVVRDYDDPARYPNVAVLTFAAEDEAIRSAVAQVQRQRSVLDVPALIVAWLAHVWAVDDRNPLASGHGIPSAAFVEAVHSVANIELTPGVASASSCPEAIWQSAKWWDGYYRESARLAAAPDAPRSPGHAIPQVPSGRYVIRRSAATGSSEE